MTKRDNQAPDSGGSVTRAGLYLRISKDATGESLGVTRQKEDCEALAAALGWTVVEIYTDNDISAYKHRPGYKRMLEDITAGRIDALAAWAPDRLYRRTADLESLIDVIEKHGISVRTVKAGDLDLTSAYGRMIARILGSVAAGEGEIKAERWKRSHRQRREAGMVVRTGTRTYGYERDGRTVIPEEAEIAREIAERIRSGTPILRMATDLEDRGIVGTKGKAWTTQGIKRYLLNPRIAGWSTLGGEIVAEGDWPPIIDRETWEEVRAMLSARTRPYVPRKALLTGLLFCGACGQRMITSKGPSGRNYRCPARPGMRGCGRVSVVALPVEEVVEEYAQGRLADPGVRARLAQLQQQSPEARAELADLELRITELEDTLDTPGVPVQTILRAVERAKDRQAELMRGIAQQSPVIIPLGDIEWPNDLAARRALVELVVESVQLMPADQSGPRQFNPERVKIKRRG